MGALPSGSEQPIASVPQKLWCHREVPPPGQTLSRCQTLMPDPAASCVPCRPRCHTTPSDPASDPAIGSRSQTLLSELRSGYVYEICCVY